MRQEEDFKDTLHNMGIQIHEQIHLYWNYTVGHKILIIYATGSVVKSFKKFGNEKTNPIFLYQALGYDQRKNYGFTVTKIY